MPKYLIGAPHYRNETYYPAGSVVESELHEASSVGSWVPVDASGKALGPSPTKAEIRAALAKHEAALKAETEKAAKEPAKPAAKA